MRMFQCHMLMLMLCGARSPFAATAAAAAAGLRAQGSYWPHCALRLWADERVITMLVSKQAPLGRYRDSFRRQKLNITTTLFG